MTIISQPPPHLFCATLQQILFDEGIFSFHELLMIASASKANRREFLSHWNWRVFILKRCLYKRALFSTRCYDYLRIKAKYYEQEAPFYRTAKIIARLLVTGYSIHHEPILYRSGLQKVLKTVRADMEAYPDRYANSTLELISNMQGDLIYALEKSPYPDVPEVKLEIAKQLLDKSFFVCLCPTISYASWTMDQIDSILEHVNSWIPHRRDAVTGSLAYNIARIGTAEGITKGLEMLSTVDPWDAYEYQAKIALCQARTNEDDAIEKSLEMIDAIPPDLFVFQDVIQQIAIECAMKNKIELAHSIANRIIVNRRREYTQFCIETYAQPIQSHALLTRALQAARCHKKKMSEYYIERRIEQKDKLAIRDAQKVAEALGTHPFSIAEARAAQSDQRAFSSAMEMVPHPTKTMVLERLKKQDNAEGFKKAIQMSSLTEYDQINSLLALADRCGKQHLPPFDDPLNTIKTLIHLVWIDDLPLRSNRYFDLIPSLEGMDVPEQPLKRLRVRK